MDLNKIQLKLQQSGASQQKIDNFIQDIKQYRITNLFYLPINSEGKYAPHELGYIAVLDKTFSLPRSALNISQHVRSLNQFFLIFLHLSFLFTCVDFMTKLIEIRIFVSRNLLFSSP